MRRIIRSLVIALALTTVLAGGAAASDGEIHSNTFCDCVGLHMSQNAPGGGVGKDASGASGGEISEAVRTCDVDGGVDFLD